MRLISWTGVDEAVSATFTKLSPITSIVRRAKRSERCSVSRLGTWTPPLRPRAVSGRTMMTPAASHAMPCHGDGAMPPMTQNTAETR